MDSTPPLHSFNNPLDNSQQAVVAYSFAQSDSLAKNSSEQDTGPAETVTTPGTDETSISSLSRLKIEIQDSLQNSDRASSLSKLFNLITQIVDLLSVTETELLACRVIYHRDQDQALSLRSLEDVAKSNQATSLEINSKVMGDGQLLHGGQKGIERSASS